MWSGFQLASKTIDIDRPLGDGSKVRVAYQGAPGEFSEAAALKAYPQCEAVPCEQFEVAFKVVELWLVDKAVLPIENSVEGSIHRNYDLLLCHSLHIVGEVQLSINHCLLAPPGLKKVDLKRVLSHPQLIALKVLRDAGAIASAQAAEIYGLDILEENMQPPPAHRKLPLPEFSRSSGLAISGLCLFFPTTSRPSVPPSSSGLYQSASSASPQSQARTTV